MNHKSKRYIVDLYEPINTLTPVDENIWIVDGPFVRMAYIVCETWGARTTCRRACASHTAL